MIYESKHFSKLLPCSVSKQNKIWNIILYSLIADCLPFILYQHENSKVFWLGWLGHCVVCLCSIEPTGNRKRHSMNFSHPNRRPDIQKGWSTTRECAIVFIWANASSPICSIPQQTVTIWSFCNKSNRDKFSTKAIKDNSNQICLLWHIPSNLYCDLSPFVQVANGTKLKFDQFVPN